MIVRSPKEKQERVPLAALREKRVKGQNYTKKQNALHIRWLN
ncbi:hypothetical protein [Hugenholtzia roseola]|nr:hypothetical protein [Hugenholtzia roseola]